MFAMFLLPMSGASPQPLNTYGVAFWVEALSGWMVYIGGVFAYRVSPREGADVSTFLRDLRTNHLEQGAAALARYRARA